MESPLDEGVFSRGLMDAAMCRSHQLTPSRPGFNNDFPDTAAMRRMVADPYGYAVEHNDGLRSGIIALGGLVGDFCFAARIDGRAEPLHSRLRPPFPPPLRGVVQWMRKAFFNN